MLFIYLFKKILIPCFTSHIIKFTFLFFHTVSVCLYLTYSLKDFSVNVNRTYPSSCCASDVADQFSISHRPLASPVVFRTDDVHQRNLNLSDIAEVTWNHVMPMDNTRNTASNAIGGAILNNDKNKIPCRAVYQKGCIDVLILWLRHTADILFVLGYCVIAFLKLCFLGILRYEIKEMIQKIKLLQTEMAQSILNSEMGEAHLQQIPVNGGMNIHTEPKVGNRDRELTRIGSAESERESLLHPEATPQFTKHKQLYACMNEHGRANCGGNGIGCDSDTNSNSALIVDDVNTATSSSSATKTINSNGNNNYELKQLFGDQWRRPSNASSGRGSRRSSVSTVRRRSRITYDRDLRYFTGTSMSERNSCECEDI
ncbi:hypothetical protein PVAND_010900 [Polypedilum vanderplanki]|uniref:Uncharacterized protein n=1 Tax=Polypedilum vanderplanki TaxID=319348 RepID=A0A9J6CHE3_POLVA|nr:hypothetical protein PVAND_010900 [Polypedilum vanderplanki]